MLNLKNDKSEIINNNQPISTGSDARKMYSNVLTERCMGCNPRARCKDTLENNQMRFITIKNQPKDYSTYAIRGSIKECIDSKRKKRLRLKYDTLKAVLCQ